MYRMKRRHAPPEKTGMKTSRGHSFAAYLQHSLLIPQMWSAFPRNLCTSAHIRGQVLTLEGQTCSLRRTFTTTSVTMCGKKRQLSLPKVASYRFHLQISQP